MSHPGSLRYTSDQVSRQQEALENWLDRELDDELDLMRSETTSHERNLSHSQSGHSLSRRSSFSTIDFERRDGRRDIKRRQLMLICACLLSVGSHFGSYLLGPIKKKLKTSEAGFATLIGSSQLVNTITPLIAGVLVLRFGAAKCGVTATGLVFLGQICVCLFWSNDGAANLGGMVIGLLIFGLGIAPLAVVQESIIIAQKPKDSKTLASSLAIGLLMGKFASFMSSATSEPLSEITPRTPFIVASAFSAFSLSAAVTYAIYDAHTKQVDELVQQDVHEHLKRKGRIVTVTELERFGDAFWLYILYCCLCGGWYTSIHLSPSLLHTLYPMSETQAALCSSIILFSAMPLYPIVGYLVDRHAWCLRYLYIVTSTCMVSAWCMVLTSTSISPIFIIIVFACGHGAAPLMLVLVVPRMVERFQVSTALGFHKSAEMGGAVLSQALSSVLLSSSTDPKIAAYRVIKQLAVILFAQFVVGLCMWRSIIQREKAADYLFIQEEPEYDPRSGEQADMVDTSDDEYKPNRRQPSNSSTLLDARSLSHIVDEDQPGITEQSNVAVGEDEAKRGWFALRVFGGFQSSLYHSRSFPKCTKKYME